MSKSRGYWPPAPPALGHRKTRIVYWVGTDEGRVGAFESFEAACAEAGGAAVGWSEVQEPRAVELLARGGGVEW